jgi:hypothetical protein
MALTFPFNESHRVRRLKMLGLLDTPVEEHFGSISRVAASLLRAPIALLSFIDETREWCKSARGMEPQSAKREESLCAQALLTNDFLVILPDRCVDGNAAISVRLFAMPKRTSTRRSPRSELTPRGGWLARPVRTRT